MEVGKKIAAVLGLIVLVGAAIVFAVRSMELRGPKLPKWLLEQKREKIDTETLEVVTLKFGEWRRLGEKDGIYKNPHTGTYSMTEVMECRSCGEKVPRPQVPEGATEAEEMDILRAYRCPKCGGVAVR